LYYSFFIEKEEFMKGRTRLLLRLLVVCVVLGEIAYSPAPAMACPNFERYEVYYNDCASKTEIGTIDRGCSCGTAYTGTTTNSLYRIDYFIDCDTHDVYNVIYYGRCNPGDSWTILSGPDACPNWC
jgi:hypothetical protein